MAITRRQFVVTLGSMAAALGLSQADLMKVTEAFAAGYTKPKVIWVHGAECTGCTTSAIGLFEDAAQTAFIDPNDALYSTDYSVLDALGIVVGGSASSVPRTLNSINFNVDSLGNSGGTGGGTSTAATALSIQDILFDILDLQYHETIMGPGGDLAYQFLHDNVETHSSADFVLVVEGAVQVKSLGGAWSDTSNTAVPWCSIGKDANTPFNELSFDHVVAFLASQTQCLKVVALGQCATYGGYPACVSPNADFKGMSQTPAYGVFDFLSDTSLSKLSSTAAAGKVINVPGCPANPWWFVLTIVLFLAHGQNSAIALDLDYGRRLSRVFPTTVHGGACPRYDSWKAGKFAASPGDSGCLMKLGCKGISTKSLCSIHGWNGLGPYNPSTWDDSIGSINGKGAGFCVAAGAPCMGCTEKGYPDAQVPFVKLT